MYMHSTKMDLLGCLLIERQLFLPTIVWTFNTIALYVKQLNKIKPSYLTTFTNKHL